MRYDLFLHFLLKLHFTHTFENLAPHVVSCRLDRFWIDHCK